MITELGHTGLVVKDMDKMIRFYQEIFGFELVLDTQVEGEEADKIVGFHVESERIVVLKLGDVEIEMLEYRPAGKDYPDGYMSNDLFGVHLAFKTNDMDADYKMLREKGVEIISEAPQTIPASHPIFGGTKVLYLRDPEGHPLELIQMPE